MTRIYYEAFYTDGEGFRHMSLVEAVNEYLELTPPESWVRQIQVRTARPLEVTEEIQEALVERVLEATIEELDELHELGNPDDSTAITDDMRATCRRYVTDFSALYPVWSVEETEVVTVDVLLHLFSTPGGVRFLDTPGIAEWIQKNATVETVEDLDKLNWGPSTWFVESTRTYWERTTFRDGTINVWKPKVGEHG